MSLKSMLAAAFAAVVLVAGSANAQEKIAEEKTKIRFTLDWKYQGIHAFVFWAKEKGYFDAEGLDVTIDQGDRLGRHGHPYRIGHL